MSDIFIHIFAYGKHESEMLDILEIITKTELDTQGPVNGWTIPMAAFSNKATTDKVLLKIIDMKPDLDLQGIDGMTATMYAFQTNRSRKVLSKMLDLKPNLNLQDSEENTVATYAFSKPGTPREILLRMLDNKKLNPNIQDSDGNTVAMIAMDNPTLKIDDKVKVLDIPKLDVNIQNYEGNSLAIIFVVYIKKVNKNKNLLLKLLDLRPKPNLDLANKYGVSVASLIAKDHFNENIILKLIDNKRDIKLRNFKSSMYLMPYNKYTSVIEHKDNAINWVQMYIDGKYDDRVKLLHYIPLQAEAFLKRTIDKNKIYKLYRGFSFHSTNSFLAWFKKTVHFFTDFKPKNKVTLNTDIITSWSYDKSISEEFMRDKTYGILIYSEFKPSQLLGDISHINEYEKEVIIKPGVIRGTICDLFENDKIIHTAGLNHVFTDTSRSPRSSRTLRSSRSSRKTK